MHENRRWGPVRYVPNLVNELISINQDLETAIESDDKRMVAKYTQRREELEQEKQKRAARRYVSNCAFPLHIASLSLSASLSLRPPSRWPCCARVSLYAPPPIAGRAVGTRTASS